MNTFTKAAVVTGLFACAVVFILPNLSKINLHPDAISYERVQMLKQRCIAHGLAVYVVPDNTWVGYPKEVRCLEGIGGAYYDAESLK